MRRRITLVTAIGAVGWLAGCGGGAGKSAAAPAASLAPSHVALDPSVTGSDAFELTGPAFAKFDKEHGMLFVLVADAATQPAPSCDFLDPTKPGVTSGAVAMFQLQSVTDAKPGSYPIGGLMFAKGEPSKGNMSMGGGSAPDGTKLEVSQMDTSTLTAEVPNPKGGAAIASIHATMCAPGSLMPQQPHFDPQEAAAMAHEPPMTNVFDMQLADGKAQKTGGEDGLVKLDPKTKVLYLYVWEFGLMPEPTCEEFGNVAKNAQSGKFAVLAVPNVAERNPGKYKLGDGQFFEIDPSTNAVTFGAGHFGDSTIDITDFNDGIFNAKIESSATAKDKVTGKMNAAVCPDGPIVFPTQEKAKGKGKGGKKKKK